MGNVPCGYNTVVVNPRGVWDKRDSVKRTRPQKDAAKPNQRKFYKFISKNIIGRDAIFEGPYGKRRVIYCDYTASGRPLNYIEDFIKNNVYEFYANTHTTANVTGRSTQRLREEAREMIKKSVNATEEDVVIFTGSGVTGAVHKLIGILNLKENKEKTVVLTSPYEHHSNILPWKETGVKVLRVLEKKKTGLVDMDDLEKQLRIHSEEGYRIIASFSAASNVTGIITDIDSVARLVHRYGGHIFCDYAAGGPYMDIDINAPNSAHKDAVLLSPHKFVGGPGTPGILIAKKNLFVNAVPHCGGGGTVVYVTRDTHRYIANIEEREEGGTPAIIEAIRAGLVFQLKMIGDRALDMDFLEQREHELFTRAMNVWKRNKNLIILGSHTARRIPIFSFLVKHPDSGNLLHYNFVAALLNDLFGIQSRGGCACAGPYAEDLLGISEYLANKFFYFLTPPEERKTEESPNDKYDIEETMEIMKPGFTRLNLPYFASDDVLNYVIDAVDLVASHGWMLLPQYTYDSHSGAWKNKKGSMIGELSLSDVIFDKAGAHVKEHCLTGDLSLDEMMKGTEQIFDTALETAKDCDTTEDDFSKTVPPIYKNLVWFMSPNDAKRLMQARPTTQRQLSFMNRKPPFKARGSSLSYKKPSYSVLELLDIEEVHD